VRDDLAESMSSPSTWQRQFRPIGSGRQRRVEVALKHDMGDMMGLRIAGNTG
jgi:hypothetical protein